MIVRSPTLSFSFLFSEEKISKKKTSTSFMLCALAIMCELFDFGEMLWILDFQLLRAAIALTFIMTASIMKWKLRMLLCCLFCTKIVCCQQSEESPLCVGNSHLCALCKHHISSNVRNGNHQSEMEDFLLSFGNGKHRKTVLHCLATHKNEQQQENVRMKMPIRYVDIHTSTPGWTRRGDHSRISELMTMISI